MVHPVPNCLNCPRGGVVDLVAFDFPFHPFPPPCRFWLLRLLLWLLLCRFALLRSCTVVPSYCSRVHCWSWASRLLLARTVSGGGHDSCGIASRHTPRCRWQSLASPNFHPSEIWFLDGTPRRPVRWHHAVIFDIPQNKHRWGCAGRIIFDLIFEAAAPTSLFLLVCQTAYSFGFWKFGFSVSLVSAKPRSIFSTSWRT